MVRYINEDTIVTTGTDRVLTIYDFTKEVITHKRASDYIMIKYIDAIDNNMVTSSGDENIMIWR